MFWNSDSGSGQSTKRRVKSPLWERLGDPSSKPQDTREVELATPGDVEGPGSRMIDRVEEDAERISFGDQLEAGIEAEQGRNSGEGQIRTDRVSDRRSEDRCESENCVIDMCMPLGGLADEHLHLFEIALVATSRTLEFGLDSDNRWRPRAGTVYRSVRLDDDMADRSAATDCSEQGLGTDRRLLMGSVCSVKGGAINGSEVNHRVWLQVEEIPGERQLVDIEPFEVRGETFDRVEVVDGEHLGVWNPLEMLNDPATGPGGRTRNEDAPHCPQSREGV